MHSAPVVWVFISGPMELAWAKLCIKNDAFWNKSKFYSQKPSAQSLFIPILLQQPKEPASSKLCMWQKLTLTAFWPWNIQYHGKFSCICRKMSKINYLLLVYRSLLVVLAFLSPYPCIQRQISAQMMEKACESLVSWRGIPWPNFFLIKI